MEASIELIRNHEITIIAESGSYPHTDNCYHVKVKNPESGAEWDDHYAPKPVVKFIFEIKRLSYFVSWDSLVDLIKIFNDYGEWKWTDGSDSESMSHDESI